METSSFIKKSAMTIFKEYSQEDKDALRELRAEVAKKLDQNITLKDIIEAVEPHLLTPAHMVGV